MTLDSGPILVTGGSLSIAGNRSSAATNGIDTPSCCRSPSGLSGRRAAPLPLLPQGERRSRRPAMAPLAEARRTAGGTMSTVTTLEPVEHLDFDPELPCGNEPCPATASFRVAIYCGCVTCSAVLAWRD